MAPRSSRPSVSGSKTGCVCVIIGSQITPIDLGVNPLKPPGHAVVSLTIGGVLWVVTKSPYSFISSLLTGVLIDMDHLVEYYWWFIKEDHTRVWYFLHSYELLVPAIISGYISGWNPIVVGASAAFLGHLLSDQIANPVAPLTYFFTYRAVKRFRLDSLVAADWENIERDFLRMPITRTVLGIFNPKMRVEK